MSAAIVRVVSQQPANLRYGHRANAKAVDQAADLGEEVLASMDLFNVAGNAPSDDIPGWQLQAEQWRKLGIEIGAAPGFSALTIKALYVTGLVMAACKSVDILLRDAGRVAVTYFPAYSVFASAIDLLGRCLRGNRETTGAGDDIAAGFRWLAQPDVNSYELVPMEQILVATITAGYTIRALVAMRHFAAHGQATSKGKLPEFDYTILGEMPPLLARGMEEYLHGLESNNSLCNQLAMANVVPYRSRPVFDLLWQCHGKTRPFSTSVGEAIRSFDWTYKAARFTLVECI